MASESKIVESPKVVLEPTKEFRLRSGKLHSHGNFDVLPGDVIYLNERQAAAFKDKFEEVDPKAAYKPCGPEVHQKFLA